MFYLFEVVDATGRTIRLSQDHWAHIRIEHPEIVEPGELVPVLTNPDKILPSDRDETVGWYFRYNKKKKRYLKVSAKYLNGDGFVITAHYTAKLK